MIQSDAKAFFRRDGEHYVGNDPARGPWSPDACHAGPVTAILAGALERAIPDKALARLTVNFRRPVPIAGFDVSAEPVKEGRAASEVSATLRDAEGRICAIAYGLHLVAGPFPDLPTASAGGPVFEEASPQDFPVKAGLHGLPFFPSGIEVAYPPGETPDPGPTTIWMRTLPIVEGETPSAVQTVCPLADCGNAISRNADFSAFSCVNPDLTLVVFRPPESEWLASRSTSFWEPSGIGMSQAQLYDTQGAIGYALQTLLVRPVQA